MGEHVFTFRCRASPGVVVRVLVTGGNGFIGRHTVDMLYKAGHEPVVFDRQGTYLGDVRDRHAVCDAASHADGIIHLAGILGTQETIGNPFPAAETNILGALNIFEAAAQYDLPTVNIAVGNWFEQNTYSISKTCAERFAFMFNTYRDTRIAVVRALNAYGPGQVPALPYGPSKVRKIIPAFVCRALAGRPIEIYGDGNQVMDMVHVTDVARALIAALTEDHGQYVTPFEVGTGRRTTVNDIARAVIDVVGEGEIVHLPMRPGETPGVEVVGDPGTLIPLGIYDLIGLEQGLPGTVESYR